MTQKTTTKDATGLDELDPSTTTARDATHFRRIVAAAKQIDAAEQELREAVAAARAAGDTWVAIGAALGTSKQNAYQRFGRTTVSFKAALLEHSEP